MASEGTLQRSGTVKIHGKTRGPIVGTCEFVIDGLSLAEDLLTVKYFDEEKFNVFFLGVTFILVQVLGAWVQAIAECIPFKTPLTVWCVGREAIQCYLYIYFSSWNDDAVFFMSIVGGIQVGLYLAIWLHDMCVKQGDDEESTEERAGWACAGCCFNTFFIGILGGTTIVFLAFEEESPFRQKQFEYCMAAYLWMFGFLSNDGLRQAKKMSGMAAQGDAESGSKVKVDNPLTMGLGAAFSASMSALGVLVMIAFAIYQYVLAWEWCLDPKISKDFDKVYTMIMIVSNTILFPYLLCGICVCCCGLCGAAVGAAGSG